MVENAIYHGIEPLAEGGIIEISGACEGGRIRISIANPVTTATARHHRGNRFAQENVSQRLLAHFGSHGGLEILEEQAKYRVIVTIPKEFDDAYRHR